MLVPVRTSVRAQVSAGARALKLRWSWAAYPLRVIGGNRLAPCPGPLSPQQWTLLLSPLRYEKCRQATHRQETFWVDVS